MSDASRPGDRTKEDDRAALVRAAALKIAYEGGDSDSSEEQQRELLATKRESSCSSDPPVAPPSKKRIGRPKEGIPPSPMVTPPSASKSAPRRTVVEASVFSSNLPDSVVEVGKASGGGGMLVPHTYSDYGQIPDDPGYVRKKTGGVSQPFPEKLYEMLESERRLHGDVVEWLPHGRAFIVRRPKEFADRIMPRLTSFQRQLNLYGFRRLTQGPDGGAYYHEMFLRGRPALCCRMKRQKVKGTGHKQPSDVNTEPNLYSFPRVVGTDYEKDNTADDPQSGTDNSNKTIEIAAPVEPQSGSPQAATAASMSPGIASIHGAAHLLRRIASDERGVPFAGLPPSASVAQPSSVSARTAQETLEPPRGAYFLRQSFAPPGDSRHSSDAQGDLVLLSPKPQLQGGHNFRTSDSTPSA